MKRIQIIIYLLAFMAIGARADNISVAPITFDSADQGVLTLSLTNTNTQWTSYQFNLTLPEGIDIATDSNGKYIYQLSSRQDSSYGLTIHQQSASHYAIVGYSAQGKPLTGTSGALLSITLKAAASLAGQQLAGQVSGILFSDKGGNETTLDGCTVNMKVSAPVVVTADSFTREYGEQNPALTYTSAGAALEGEPAISCTATPTSPVGDYPIVISKGSVTNYKDSYVNGTLTVEKALLTITVASVSRKQGEPTPAFTVTYSGFKNGETESVLTIPPTVTCEARYDSPVGTYPIIVRGAEAENYEIKYVFGTLTITDAPAVEVTADSYTIEYGDALPTFGYTSMGEAYLVGTPSISCEATSSSPVGTYPIVISKGSVSNYNDHYVNGTLTIKKAPLTITANAASKKQGDPMPEFTVTYTGFKNGETNAVLTSQPTITCNATANSPNGTYPITVSGAAAQNYEITYVNGTLTILPPETSSITYYVKDQTGAELAKETAEVAVGTIISDIPGTLKKDWTTYEYDAPLTITEGGEHYEFSAVASFHLPFATSTSEQKKWINIYFKDNGATYYLHKDSRNILIGNASEEETDEDAYLWAIYGNPYTNFIIKNKEVTFEDEGYIQNDNSSAYISNRRNAEVLVLHKSGNTCFFTSAASGENLCSLLGVVGFDRIINPFNLLFSEPKDPVFLYANNLTMQYGDEIPELTFIALGAPLDGTPSVTCSATSHSPVGTYPIVISKGNLGNTHAHYTNGTLTITKAPLTITANDASKKQGEVMPELTVSYEGFKNGETANVLTTEPTITCEADATSPAGSYPIIVNGAAAQNYDITYHNGTLTVNEPDPVTITALDYTIEYGDALPTFGYTSSGATLVGTPSISCEATSASPVGTYPIIISKGSVSNYNDHYVNGTLTIKKAPLTITVQSATKKQGDPNPTFTLNYEGFKNGEGERSLRTPPTVTCTATTNSPAGSYDILVSGAEAANYEITYVNGTLTIYDGVVFTANSYTREYGEANPTFDYTWAGAEPIGTPAITCEATVASPVGTYPIVISRGSVTNEGDSYVNGTLTIKKAPLTITVNNYQKAYGEENPRFTISYNGFKNGETAEVLNTQPTITCEATANSEPGEYPITISGASAQNYEITYVAGILTVTAPDTPITLTANSYTIAYGDPLPTFGYTAEGDELVGEPSISCEASQGSAVGAYPIVISQGSISNFNEITYLNGTLTITPAPLTITANDSQEEYGEENPAFSVRYSGFKNNETADVLSVLPTLSCEGQDVGTYPIAVSGAEAQNYEISYVNGTLTITPAPLTITANDSQKEYGEENPALSVSYAGFKNNETADVLSVLPTLSCEGQDVGTYPIVVSGAEAQNYEISYLNGTLTITPATLTVRAKDVSRYEGEANPELEVEYSGWKLDDDESVLTEKAVASTEADASSQPGTYAITVSGGAAQNYVLTHVPGTLTVQALPSYIIPYGDMSFLIPDAQTHEVILTTVEDKPHVVVPSSVQYRDQEWTVTGLADSIFARFTALVTVEIPATVTSVGKDLFDRCQHLAAIVWRSPVKMTSGMMGHFTNKNLLLYVADKETALSGMTNVIDLSTLTATQIVLTDDGSTNDFYCPMAFTAAHISYSHDYQQQTRAGSSQGWDALTLPFDVASVVHEQKGEIHPFATLTDDQIISGQRPFWLYEYSTGGFKAASRIAANTPYIISMPNETSLWDDYILGGKVTFLAANATVRPTDEASGVSNGGRTFHPNFSTGDGSGQYLLNVGQGWNGHAEGSVFVQALRATRPFEACFTSTSDAKAFGVMDAQADAIRSIMRSAESATSVYDLSGRKVQDGHATSGELRRGLYIVSGKKYIKR